MRYLFPLLLLTLALALTSCATIIDGTSTNVNITSQPSGATIFVDGIERGTTPTIVSLDKNDFNKVVLKKAGFGDTALPIERKFAGWTVGNLGFAVFFGVGAIVGVVVDVASGAVQRISPASYNVELNK